VAITSKSAEETRHISSLTFCSVVVLQIIGLSIALDSGIIEFLYFLAIACSQIYGGLLVLSAIDKTEVRRSLPEAITLGFIVGSASAAIAQLLLRDLIGIRWPISPYVPIVLGVFGTVVKRRRLDCIRISTSGIETLIWLLLPVPTLFSAYNWPIFVFVALPTGLLLLKSGGMSTKSLICRSTSILTFGSTAVWLLTSRNAENGSGISRVISDDARWDLAHAIGVSTWGISSNIDFAGYHFSYFKIALLWIGPILAPIGESAINIIEYAVPMFLVVLLGFALWTVAIRLFNSTRIAGLAPSILYVQVLLPDSIQVNLRVVHLLGLIFLIAALPVCLLSTQVDKFENLLLFLTFGFFVAGTRLQFLPQVFLACVFVVQNQKLQRRALKSIFGACLALGTGAFLAIIVFSGGIGGNEHTQLYLAASEWPFSISDLFLVSAIFVLSTTIPFLWISVGQNRYLTQYLVLSVLIFFACQFLFPHLFLRDIDFFVAHYLVSAPIIGYFVFTSLDALRKEPGFKCLIGIFAAVGLAFRISYDAFHYGMHRGNLLFKFATWLTRREIYLNLSFVVMVLICALLIPPILKTSIKRRHAIALGFFVANLGVFAATSLNPLADAVFNDESLSSSGPTAIVQRWENRELIDGLVLVRSITTQNEIIASNMGVFENAHGMDDFRLQIIVKRQLYLASIYSHLRLNFSEMFYSSFGNSERFSPYQDELIRRFDTSINFALRPSKEYLNNMTSQGVTFYIVDIERTPLRTWEPWATTEFINDKVAVLRLARSPAN